VIQLSFATAITLIVAIVTMIFAFGRILMVQFEKRMAEKFNAQAELRATEKESSSTRMAKLENDMGGLIRRVETLSVKLPLEYVRREDWIRFSTTIDTKLDRLAELVHQRFNAGNET
jgi:hypothetical protein